ncbi:hypothetical protein IM793_19025 [Pedobacter sp. MR2016-19]|uniref:hypothetical protein n=1 Tax=Pedobacter sp. MR2016-19 TaxID=2780089 RepID=UPI001875D7BF|nr:hypothetical protein [Pedobacter sp. MR2016-19]MBE5321262.1 hypothetical protein [Pedobacter sp. MR2016-19]
MKKRITLLPQRTKILFVLFGIFTLLFCFNACRKIYSLDENQNEKSNFSTNTHSIDYSAGLSDSTLHFKIKVYKNDNHLTQIDETFDIDMRKNSFNKNIANILKEKSKNVEYDKLSSNDVKIICNAIKDMITKKIESLSPDEIKSPKIQGLYLSLSFARRLLKNKSATYPNLTGLRNKNTLSTVVNPFDTPPNQIQPYLYEQDVYEGTTIGLSPFILNEDIIINKEDLLLVISQDLSSIGQDSKGLYIFQTVLNGINQSTFTLKDFLREIDTYRALHPELIDSFGGWWPSGSDHGCCGNYVGSCKVWHPICYIHDKICKKCTPRWFCLGGCIPDKTSSEFGPQPFTLIEDSENEANLIFLPQPLPDSVYYAQSLVVLNLIKPSRKKPIFYSSTDRKYYSDAAFQILLENGYYVLPDDLLSKKYYRIVNGQVASTGVAVYR